MPKTKTHEEYVSEVKKINNNIEVIETYVNSHTPILHRCHLDQYEWYVLPMNILKGHGCPKCSGTIKKTNEQYAKELQEINKNIIVIGEYINAKTPILHKCLVDGYEWLASPSNLLRVKGCPICGNKSNGDKLRKSHEEYVCECKTLHPNIEVLGTYINAKTPILHRCMIDGHEWPVAPSHILTGTGCPKCANNIKRTHEEYVQLLTRCNPTIEAIEEYIDANTPILHYCTKHNIFWNAAPYHILHGSGCFQCGKEKIKEHKCKTHDQYIDELNKVNPCITVVDKYVGSHIPIMHYCSIHDYHWLASPGNILRGERCPLCGNQAISAALRKDHAWYIQRIQDLRPNVEVLEEYVDYRTPILHRCKIDGYEWKTTPCNILRNIGCPKCCAYKGENKIAEWLNQHDINYVFQYRFIDCKDQRTLPFDFYLPDYNICIEYDGRQHFMPIDFSGKGERYAIDAFKVVQLHDQIKTEYCKHCNIDLLRIPYNKDIEEELKKFFVHLI